MMTQSIGIARDDAAAPVESVAELFAVLYEQLCRKAAMLLMRRGRRHAFSAAWAGMLPPAALVHEAFVKLAVCARVDWRSRAHFYHGASRAMHQILVDEARQQVAAKRGGGKTRFGLDDIDAADERQRRCGGAPAAAEAAAVDDEALQAALGKLRRWDGRQHRVVTSRYLVGMSEAQVAALLGVTVKTVQRDWRAARRFLAAEMTDQREGTNQ
jgi:RNA polymerase sigma factor (TIGR02999 family)